MSLREYITYKLCPYRRTMYNGRLQSFVAGVQNIGEPFQVEVSHSDLLQKWNLRKIMIQNFSSNIK